jgi:hypothetical protein
MEIIIASRIGQLVGRPEGFDGGKVGETLECEVLKVVAKGAQGAWTEWERGSFSCELVIGLVVLKVVEERVEVRLFWRVPRVRLAYVEILLVTEREIKQPQPSPSPLESIGSFAATRLQCHGLQIGE